MEIQWLGNIIISPIGEESETRIDKSVQIGLGPADPVTGVGPVFWRNTP